MDGTNTDRGLSVDEGARELERKTAYPFTVWRRYLAILTEDGGLSVDQAVNLAHAGRGWVTHGPIGFAEWVADLLGHKVLLSKAELHRLLLAARRGGCYCKAGRGDPSEAKTPHTGTCEWLTRLESRAERKTP